MGGESGPAWEQDIATLFSEHFTKKANGSLLVENRDKLKSQAYECLKEAGSWTLTVKEIIPSFEGTKCTLRYTLTTEKAGAYDVIALLCSKDGRHIDYVEEFYYPLSP